MCSDNTCITTKKELTGPQARERIAAFEVAHRVGGHCEHRRGERADHVRVVYRDRELNPRKETRVLSGALSTNRVKAATLLNCYTAGAEFSVRQQ